MALLLVAYGLTVAGRLRPGQRVALAMNLAGSLLILVSLVHAFNLPSAVIEVAWAAIALVGLVRGERR